MAADLFSQLFTIHCIEHGVSMPAVYVLMTNRDANSYETMFDRIFNLIDNLGEPLCLEHVTCDFESGLIVVLRKMAGKDRYIDIYQAFSRPCLRPI